jgi:uncharacterized protein YndB with AHSA1/START domain
MGESAAARSEAIVAPIKLTARVQQSAADAFRLFTDGIDSWWPLHDGYSYAAGRTKEIHLEAFAGGRFYERLADGEELVVGRVLICEPPKRIVFTWRGVDWPASTEVDVSFTPEGGSTRVDLEHRGWEQLGPTAEEQRRSFANGWPTVFSRYTNAAGVI